MDPVAEDFHQYAIYLMVRSDEFALERLTKEQLEFSCGVKRVIQSVEQVLSERRNLEVDVVGETAQETTGSERTIVLCSCKLNPGKPDVGQTKEYFDRDRVFRKAENETWENRNILRDLVSPNCGKNRIQPASFRFLDFAYIAGSPECD